MEVNALERYRELGLSPELKKAEANQQKLGQDEFLKLMTTQMTHQDPNKPMENGDFLAQMAQFSTVEGVGRLNDSFTEFSRSLTSGQALQAATLVGQSVMVVSDQAELSLTNGLSGEVNLKGQTGALTVEIIDPDGNTVKTIALGEQKQGNIPFEWDGLLKDGQQAEEGIYHIKAESMIDGKNTVSQTYVNAGVKSVSLGRANEAIKLELVGLGHVNFNEIKKIF